MNKIVIFGASGNVGLFAIDAALKKGLSVRVLLRDATKLPDDVKEKVEVIVGDVTHHEDVEKAVIGQDAVVVTLGTRNDLSPTTVLSDGLKNIILAMQSAGIQLISVCLSAFLFWEPTKVPALFKDLNADHQRMFDCVKQSNLKWIAVLPGHFTDEPNGDYIIKHDESPGRTVSKRDLAAFLIESLSKSEHYNKVCGIASTPAATVQL